jgi:hypothetical protein
MVALSTTEAEYVACSEAAREGQWLAKLHTDNIQAAGYGKSRNKHIDVKLHHYRDLHATQEL